jgi:hypothetical protein
MKTRTNHGLAGVVAGVVLLGLAGCQGYVREGPVNVPPGGGPGADIIRATEPEPESIPQKEVPAGQSSLRKTGPDRPLYP